MSKCVTCSNCNTKINKETGKICAPFKETRYLKSYDLFKCYTNTKTHLAYNKDFRYVSGYKEEWTPAIQSSANDLLKKVNSLFTELAERTGKKVNLRLTSGWRPKKYSREIGTSTRSAHTTGQGIDIYDYKNEWYDIIMNNMDLVLKYNLFIENKRWTRSWLHLQTRPTRNRVFIP